MVPPSADNCPPHCSLSRTLPLSPQCYHAKPWDFVSSPLFHRPQKPAPQWSLKGLFCVSKLPAPGLCPDSISLVRGQVGEPA